MKKKQSNQVFSRQGNYGDPINAMISFNLPYQRINILYIRSTVHKVSEENRI